MTTPSQTTQSVTTNTSARRARTLAITGAVLATSLLWLAAKMLDIDLRVHQPHDTRPAVIVGLPLVVGLTLALSLLGWGALAVLERRSRRAKTIWNVLAIAVLMLSFVPILDVEATSATKIVLSMMHVAVAAVLIPILRARSPKPTAPPEK